MLRHSIVYGTLALLVLSGCPHEVRDECIEALSRKIFVGMTQHDAEKMLDACGCTHSYDPKTNVIQASKPAKRGWFMQSDWNVLITLDQEKKVKSTLVKQIVTGP